MAKVYHVTGNKYQPGDPILCWDTLLALGIVSADDWKWAEADMGVDGDVVCVFDAIEDTQDFATAYGGHVLAVEVPETDDLGNYDIPWGGYISPRWTRVEEGYRALREGIPAEWIVK